MKPFAWAAARLVDDAVRLAAAIASKPVTGEFGVWAEAAITFRVAGPLVPPATDAIASGVADSPGGVG